MHQPMRRPECLRGPELWEETAELMPLFQMIEDAARDWDGRDPIRRL